MKSPVPGMPARLGSLTVRWVAPALFGWLLLAGPVPLQAAPAEERSNPCVVAMEMASKGIALFERQYDQGLAAMESAAAMCPADPSIAFNLGLAHYQAGHLEKAESVWDTLFTAPSAQDAPNREKTLTNLAWVKFELGKDKEALQLSTEGFAAYPGSWGLAHTRLFSLFRMGRYLEAYDWLTRSGLSGVRADQWQQQASEYVVETLWRTFRECPSAQPGKPCRHDGQLPAIRQAINLLVKEYPQDVRFIEAKDRLLAAHLDQDADIPYPIDLPHEAWSKTGNVDDRSILLDEHIKALPPMATWEKREDAFAVIIGIGHYQHLRARHFADRDALHMQKLLVERGVFKNDVDHVRLRIDQEANRATLTDDLQWLVRQGQLNPSAMLLVYFAGLGASQAGEITVDDALLLPVETHLEEINPKTTLSLNALKTALDKLPNPEIAVILDTCFNETKECAVYQGATLSDQVANPTAPTTGVALHGLAPTPEFFKGHHTWVIAAMQQKTVMYGPGRQGGLTYFLLKGMLGAADGTNGTSPDGWVDLAEAFAFAKQHLPETDPLISQPTKMRLTKTKGEK
ncbi:MAG: caspase family protein [Magnetococcales bacterium]|nr:caspase family protein [Magnetococcales bacterium]